MTLLLDLGNTRLKCARARGAHVEEAVRLTHAEHDFEARFEQWLASQAATAAVWLAAVAPEPVIARVDAVLQRNGRTARRALVQRETLGLRVAYAQPQRLGVDRWLGMLAARARGEGAVLIASVGSALTVDAIDAQGQHLGGLIAPPAEAMRAALIARAPRLDVAHGEIARFAASTEDAIASGCLLAAAALIERSHAELAQRVGARPRLILTGGGIEPLRAWLPEHELAPQLVLEGLLLLSQHTPAGSPEPLPR